MFFRLTTFTILAVVATTTGCGKSSFLGQDNQIVVDGIKKPGAEDAKPVLPGDPPPADGEGPVAEISGQPEGTSSKTTLNVTVSGENVVKYKSAVQAGLTCDQAKWSDVRDVATLITDSIDALPDGDVTICVLGIDAANKVQAEAKVTKASWKKDTTPGIAQINGAPQGRTAVASVQATINGNGVVKYVYKYVIDGACPTAASGYSPQRPLATAITIPNYTSLPDGEFRICALGVDAQGNMQAASSPTIAKWTKDRTPPAVTITNAPSGNTLANNALNITISDAKKDAVSYDYTLVQTANCPTTVPTNLSRYTISTKITQSQANFAYGNWTLCVWGQDAAGNKQTTPTKTSWTRGGAGCQSAGVPYADGSLETRVGYTDAYASPTWHCNSLYGTDTRKCTNGVWGAWSGSHTHLSCVEASCGNTPHGSQESRYGALEGLSPYGENCDNMMGYDYRRCEYGVWGPWSGEHIYSGCYPRGCGGEPHGYVQSRKVYKTSSCSSSSGQQQRSCQYGLWTAWSGSSYNYTSCTNSQPADDQKSCGSIANGSRTSRVMYSDDAPPAGRSCRQVTQYGRCVNGVLDWDDGDYYMECRETNNSTPRGCPAGFSMRTFMGLPPTCVQDMPATSNGGRCGVCAPMQNGGCYCQ